MIALCVGTAASVTRNLVNGLATTRLGLQANIVVLGWTRAIPYVALKTANMQAGVAAGMPQGQLQGCCERRVAVFANSFARFARFASRHKLTMRAVTS